MKNIFCSLFLGFSLLCSGQTNSDVKSTSKDKPKYEFGFNLFSITDLERENPILESNYVVTTNLFSGVFVKTHFNKNILRVSFDYSNKPVNIDNSDSYYGSRITGNKEKSEYRIGYEREFHIKRIIPYLSADLSYQFNKENLTRSSYFDYMSAPSDLEFQRKRNRYSLCIGTGVKFMLTKNIILSYEFNIQYGYETYLEKTQYYEGYKFQSEFQRINPVRQIGLSILF